MKRLLALAAVAGCWKSGRSPEPMPTNLEASAHDPTGNYWCAIDDEKNLEFLCQIERTNGKLRLAKMNGAERIRGVLELKGDTMEFTGERFCMWEDCKAKLVGTFVPVGNGQYRGTFKDAPLVVRLAPMPAGTVVEDVDTSGAPAP